MICSAWEIEVDKVYKFQYNGHTRVAVAVKEISQDLFTCWDFTIQAYRSFDFHTIHSDIHEVTSFCTITENLDATFSPGVRTREIDGKLYAVNLKR